VTAADAALDEAAPSAVDRPAWRALRRLTRRRGAMVGLAVVVFFVAIALLAPFVAPYDPLKTSWSAVRKAPSAAHWFGTDEIGRDVLSRIIYGARASLLAGVVSVCISLILGVPIGLVSGYVGRWLDGLLMRITDAMLATPFLILAIALAAFLGPSLTNAMIAIGISAMPPFIRLTRAQVMAAKVEDYVEAARAVGNPHRRIVLRHILPNILPLLIVYISLIIPGLILAETGLSFLGIGVQVPTPSWGNMLGDAQQFFRTDYANVIIPGFMIYITSLSMYLVGSGLRDAFDPKLSE
jgi:peptide/nickel transport system permease protein